MIPLSPEICNDSQRLRGFLRLSRIATDDTIRTHLNAVKSGECDEYFQRQIASQWKARTDAIKYCGDYSKTIRAEIIEETKEPPEVDLRLDPYAMANYKNKIQEKYNKVETIENWVSNEKSVELIIREQSIGILNDKCYYKDWLKEFEEMSRDL